MLGKGPFLASLKRIMCDSLPFFVTQIAPTQDYSKGKATKNACTTSRPDERSRGAMG
jgi:hypothetical protein